jgi:signal peptidase I
MILSRGTQSPKVQSKVREYVSSILIALVCFLFIRTSVVEAYRIPSGSMEDTLLIGDFLLANKFIYGARIPLVNLRLPAFRDPRAGDIVIFRSPVESDKTLIKRCVAVEGQTVEIRNKTLYIDGKIYPLPAAGKFVDPAVRLGEDLRDNFGPVRIPPGHLFMMGDNRDNSFDSRYFGPVSRDAVLGEAMVIYFSWNSAPPLWDIPHKIHWGRLGQLIQ